MPNLGMTFFKQKKRVKLISTDDFYTKLKSGDLGWAWGVSKDPLGSEQKLEVDWDSGSTLSLIFGADNWEYVKE